MIEIMFVIAVIALSMFLTFMIMSLVEWRIHIQMVKYSTKKYDFVTFKRFYKEFSKHKYDKNLIVKNDSIMVGSKSRADIMNIRSDIIAFGDKGMILYPWSWVKFQVWKDKFIKEYNSYAESKRIKDLWG